MALPDGRTVVACSFPDGGYDPADQPDFGLYLDARWQPPWPHDHIDWPDFGLPTDVDALMTALRHVLDRVSSGQVVEIGCLGGHGRTGTALACLAVLAGGSDDPVGWIREVYCTSAVETEDQVELVRVMANTKG